MKYKGWRLYRGGVGSQTHVAERHGVTMRSNSVESLKQMIDSRDKQIDPTKDRTRTVGTLDNID